MAYRVDLGCGRDEQCPARMTMCFAPSSGTSATT
jgi:hypothetical protein